MDNQPFAGSKKTVSDAPQIQSYRPYRGRLLIPAQLKELNKLRPGRMMRDTALLRSQILLAWAAVAAIPVIGTRFYALFIIGHDGLHRRLFRDRRRNDLWNDFFILGPVGAITRLNRLNHMSHHDTLALPHDPDRYKYVADDKLTFSTYLFSLTGLRYVLRALRHVFVPRPAKEQRSAYTLRDLAILLGWQALLAGSLTFFIGWWAYPLLWLLPVYIFAFTADIVRVFLEHSYPETDAVSDRRPRLITYTSNAIERRLFAPMNMNFHAAHHLWPSIPYYNLPDADALIRALPAAQEGLEWRPSYIGQLRAFGRWRRVGGS